MATTVKTFTWNSDLESFTTSTAGSTGNATAERDASNGSTAAGSLHSYCVGRKDESIGTFTLSGASWEDLGVPAGKVVTAVQVTGIETYYGLVHDNVSDDFGPVTVSLGGTQLFSRALSGSADGAWQSGSGSSSPVSDEASSATNDIVIVATADSGNNSSAAAGVHVDDLELTITYEDVAFTATGAITTPAASVVGVGDYTAPPSDTPVIESVGATNTATSGTTLTLTKPTGLAADDLMVAFLVTQNGNPSPAFSRTGWTVAATPDTGSATTTTVLYRVADSTDASAANFDFTCAATIITAGGFIYRISGFDSTTPLAAVAQTNTNTSANPVPPASGTVDLGDYLCLTSVSFENDFPITHPSGYTEDVELQINASRDATLAVASKDCLDITSETPGNWADVTLPYHTYTILVAASAADGEGTGSVVTAPTTTSGTGSQKYSATGAIAGEAVAVSGVATGQDHVTSTGDIDLAASTVTGAATQTLSASGSVDAPSATVSGAATSQQQADATGAVSVPSATVSGAAALAYAAAGDIDLASIVVDGVAESLQNVTSTGTVGLAAATVSGTGAQAHAATGAISGEAVTVTGDATQTVASTGAITVGAVTVSGAAAQSYAATGGIVGVPPVASGVAESLAASEATGAVDLAGLFIDGVAVQSVSSTGMVATGAVSVSGVAIHSEGFAGTGAVTTAPAAVSGTGAQTYDATGAISGEPVTVTGAATQTSAATGAISGQPAEVAGTAAQACVATGDIALTAPTLDGAGTFATSGDGAIDLASATVDGTGAAVIAHTATGEIALPVVDVDGTGDNGAYVAPSYGGSRRRQLPARPQLIAAGDISLPAMQAAGKARNEYDDLWFHLAPDLYLAGVLK